jgi:penicillin amidase
MTRLLLFILPFSVGCSLLTSYPDYQSQKQRFRSLESTSAPVSQKVSIYWQQNSIPFVEAQTDEDLAFAIGLVHAHLRLGQMEVLRYVSQGRLSEVAGPVGLIEKIDQFLRVINFRQAAEASLAKLSPQSQQWLSQFTKGINWYISEKMKQAPVEFEVLGKRPTPFTELEILTLGKLIGADLTWAVYLKYLKLKEQKGWKALLTEGTADLAGASSTVDTRDDVERVIQLLKGLSKSGSNSLVVSGKKTESGSAMIASDPHVGIFLPNFWLLMGIRSPSTHALGYMIPGVPFIGVGRNRDLAWGGTNMRGISSHLFRIPKNQLSELKTEKQTLKRRWWTDKIIELKVSEFGPVFNDNSYFDQDQQRDKMALYWVGKQGSDELDTFLKVQRSRNWQEFREAFDSYRVSAMNILYADKQGNIGMMPAYGQPVLKDPSRTLDLYKEWDNPIVKILKPTEQSNPYNPEVGFIASANNKPFSHTAIPYSYAFSNNDRVDRMKSLMKSSEKVQLDDLKKLQLDVYSLKSHKFAKLLTSSKTENFNSKELALFEALKRWDGKFAADSKGGAAAEIMKVFAWQSYIENLDLPEFHKDFRNNSGDKLKYLNPWLEALPKKSLSQSTKGWLRQALPHFESTGTWGELQRQPQQSPLGMIPLIGSRFALEDYPASGGDDTLNKSGRKFSASAESATYGASARHISDLSDIDENYFVMHGGNDGWLMNDQLADQVSLWRKGRYIKIPLSMEKVRNQFTTHLTELKPQK